MAKNDFQYGGWNSYTLHVARSWHWFRQMTATAMWHVALESWQWIHQVAAPCNVIRGSGYGFNGMLPGITWHWIRQVAAPCSVAGDSGLEWHAIEFAQTSAILEFYIWFRFRQHHCSRHVILHQSPEFYPNRTTLGREKWRHVDFQDGGSQPPWILGIQ